MQSVFRVSPSHKAEEISSLGKNHQIARPMFGTRTQPSAFFKDETKPF